jgi:hypothetical protein
MNESSGLQSLSRRLMRHPGRRELAQFLIDQGQKLLGGFGITLFNRLQNVRHIAHRLREYFAGRLAQ